MTPTPTLTRSSFAAVWFFLSCLTLAATLSEVHGQFPLAVIAPITSVSQEYLAAAVAFDLDVRKHTEPELKSRLGDPVIEVPNLSEDLTFNVSIGTCHSDVSIAFQSTMQMMQGGVGGLVGLADSATSASAARFAEYYKVPQISFGATSPDLSDKGLYAYFLRTIPSDSILGRGLWQFLRQCSVRSAGFIYSQEPYGEGLFEAVSTVVPVGSTSFVVSPHPVPYATGTINATEAKIITQAAMSTVTKVVFLAMVTDQATLFLPLASQEGLFSASYQVVGTESVQLDAGPNYLPNGYMYFSPANEGSRYAALQTMWQALTLDDIYGSEAQDRYSYDDFQVALADSTSPALTADMLTGGFTEDRVSFLFDAAYSFVFALNSLLNSGSTLETITGEALLAALKSINFEGVSGPVSFDANGDRTTAYHVVNVQNGMEVQAALYSSDNNLIIINDGAELLWTEGTSGLNIPSSFIDCSSLSYLDSQAVCRACPSNQIPTADRRGCEDCPASTVPLSDGSCGYNPLKLGMFGPITSLSMDYLAMAVVFDLDFRKNHETSLVEQFGPPIINIPDLNPGLRMSLQIGNSNSDPDIGMAEALDYFQGQNGREAVQGLMGGLYSSITMPIASLATQFKVPIVSYGATNAKLSSKDEYPYFLRTIPPDSIQGSGLWRYIKHFSIGSVTFIYCEESYSEGLFQTVSNLASKASESFRVEAASIVWMSVSYDTDIARATIRQVQSMSSKVFMIAMTSDQGRYFFEVAVEEGLWCATCQAVGSEALSFALLADAPKPTGWMWFSPVSQGEALYPAFEVMWKKLKAENITGAAATARYGLDLFKVGMTEGVLDPITDDAFADTKDLAAEGPFLFDCGYAYVIAANTLLNEGIAMDDIVGTTLLDRLFSSDFVGISGRVTFDENGDRLASYNIYNLQPIDDTDSSELTSAVVAIYSSADDAITVQTTLPYWMVGVRGATLPEVITACGIGYFKNEHLICQACAAGTYSAGGSVTACERCPTGRVANAALGATGCVDCLAGTAGLEVASVNCTVCPAGSFSSSDAATECTTCDQAFYQPESRQTSCLACGSNMLTLVKGSASESECLCKEGYYRDSHDNEDAPCLPCIEGMTCASGSDMKHFYTWMAENRPAEQDTFPHLLSGYMSKSSDPLSVFKCMDATKCPGGAPGVCAAGVAKDVPGCEYCEDGLYWDGDACSSCTFSERTALVFPLVPSLLSPIVFAFLYRASSTNSAKWGGWRFGLASMAFLLLNHYQMTTLISDSNIRTPGPVGQVFEVFKFSENPWSLFNTDCAGFRDTTSSMLLKTIAPIVVLALLVLTYLGTQMLAGLKFSKFPAWDRDTTMNVYFSLLFTFFAGIAAMSLDTFKCSDNPNGISTLVSDQSILCGSGDWWGLVAIAVVAVIIYLLGVGGLFSWAIIVAPNRFALPAFRRRWGFLFYRFRPDVWWWGLLFLLKGIGTNVGYMLFRLGVEQMYWLMAILAIYGGLITLFFPWRLRAVSALDLYTNLALLFVCSLMGCYSYARTEADESVKDGITIAIVVINMSPLFAAVLVAAHIMRYHLNPATKEDRLKALERLSPSLTNFATADLTEKAHVIEGLDEWARSYLFSALHIISAEFNGLSLKARLTDKSLLSKSSLSGSQHLGDHHSQDAAKAANHGSGDIHNSNNNNKGYPDSTSRVLFV